MIVIKTIVVFLCLYKITLACTAFGIVNELGTVIGKNRDAAYYAKQDFIIKMPIKQFNMWYDNHYNHHHRFYALVAQDEVKMGVNESGLSIIEEDPLYPNNYVQNRQYLQPINGNSENMVLYGILQNFSTVSEILPYLPQIFSTAAPNFYQIADGNSILIIEVEYGKSKQAKTRKFTHKVIKSQNKYFTHTNTYLSTEFQRLNLLELNKDKLLGANNRLKQITDFIISGKQNYQDWLMDMTSKLTSNKDKNWCQTTSIFRSNMQNENIVEPGILNHKVYGTVSNFIVVNNRNPNKSSVYVKIIDSIILQNNGTQLIQYRELNNTLYNLFHDEENSVNFQVKKLVRAAPVNQICS